MTETAPERAIFFVDGNNWFHSLVEAGVPRRYYLNFAKMCEKLSVPREWLATRYYIGQVRNDGDAELYNQQRSYLGFLASCDSRISIHLGRMESHPVVNETAVQLRKYLANLPGRIDPQIYKDLSDIAQTTDKPKVFTEKAVDVHMAVDMVVKAERDEYDTAYILTADGDFTPAVDAVREMGKKVFAVSPGYGAQLARKVNSFIRLKPDWFSDCYGKN